MSTFSYFCIGGGGGEGIIDVGCGKTLIEAQIGMWMEITNFIQVFWYWKFSVIFKKEKEKEKNSSIYSLKISWNFLFFFGLKKWHPKKIWDKEISGDAFYLVHKKIVGSKTQSDIENSSLESYPAFTYTTYIYGWRMGTTCEIDCK